MKMAQNAFSVQRRPQSADRYLYRVQTGKSADSYRPGGGSGDTSSPDINTWVNNAAFVRTQLSDIAAIPVAQNGSKDNIVGQTAHELST